jgi:hypothetical protein
MASESARSTWVGSRRAAGGSRRACLMALELGVGFPHLARSEDCRRYPSIVKSMSSTSCTYKLRLHSALDKVQPTRTIVRSVSPSTRSCGLSPVSPRFSGTSSKIDQKD